MSATARFVLHVALLILIILGMLGVGADAPRMADDGWAAPPMTVIPPMETAPHRLHLPGVGLHQLGGGWPVGFPNQDVEPPPPYLPADPNWQYGQAPASVFTLFVRGFMGVVEMHLGRDFRSLFEMAVRTYIPL